LFLKLCYNLFSRGPPSLLSYGLKWPGHEADHSPLSGAEVNNVWSYTFTPPYVFIAWCLVKHRDTFTFVCLFIMPIPVFARFCEWISSRGL